MEVHVEIAAVILSIFGTVVLSFWGWLVVRVIELSKEIAELKSRMDNQENTCDERLEWMRNIDKKTGETAENVKLLVGKLCPSDENVNKRE